MREWLEKYKSEIIVGVVVFIITTVFSQLGKWIVSTGPSAGRSILASLRHLVFYNAARQSSFSLVVMFITTLFLLFFSLIITSTVKAITEMQKQIDIEELESLCESLDDEKIDEKAKKAIVVDAQTRLDKFKKKYNVKPESKPKKQKRSLYIYLFFVIILIIYFIFYVFTPALLWDSFERIITMVTPYAGDLEIKMLRSKWVSMESFDDYKYIDARLLQIREEHNLIR